LLNRDDNKRVFLLQLVNAKHDSLWHLRETANDTNSMAVFLEESAALDKTALLALVCSNLLGILLAQNKQWQFA
jgi:hypothetical protein